MGCGECVTKMTGAFCDVLLGMNFVGCLIEKRHKFRISFILTFIFLYFNEFSLFYTN